MDNNLSQKILITNSLVESLEFARNSLVPFFANVALCTHERNILILCRLLSWSPYICTVTLCLLSIVEGSMNWERGGMEDGGFLGEVMLRVDEWDVLREETRLSWLCRSLWLILYPHNFSLPRLSVACILQRRRLAPSKRYNPLVLYLNDHSYYSIAPCHIIYQSFDRNL